MYLIYEQLSDIITFCTVKCEDARDKHTGVIARWFDTGNLISSLKAYLSSSVSDHDLIDQLRSTLPELDRKINYSLRKVATHIR